LAALFAGVSMMGVGGGRPQLGLPARPVIKAYVDKGTARIVVLSIRHHRDLHDQGRGDLRTTPCSCSRSATPSLQQPAPAVRQADEREHRVLSTAIHPSSRPLTTGTNSVTQVLQPADKRNRRDVLSLIAARHRHADDGPLYGDPRFAVTPPAMLVVRKLVSESGDWPTPNSRTADILEGTSRKRCKHPPRKSLHARRDHARNASTRTIASVERNANQDGADIQTARPADGDRLAASRLPPELMYGL